MAVSVLVPVGYAYCINSLFLPLSLMLHNVTSVCGFIK
jgi:hypothetical protein